MPLLEPICTMLRKEREREIKQLALHNQQRQCELSAYQHAVMPIDVVLKKNTHFKDAPPFQLVRNAIQRVVDLNLHLNIQQDETNTTSATSAPAMAAPAAFAGLRPLSGSSDQL
jgi:hypothetical protein